MTASLKGRKPTTASAVLREFFKEADKRKQTDSEVSDAVGVFRSTLSRWRHGRTSPTLIDMECAAQAIGLRLVLVRDSE